MMPARDTKSSKSIINQTLKQMTTRLSLIIAISTAVAILHLGYVIDSEMVGVLNKYIQERGAREQKEFVQAQLNHSVLTKEFLALYSKSTDQEVESRFRQLVKMYPDGVMRNSDPHFDGKSMVGIFIGRGASLTAQHKRKIVVAYDIVNRFGTAFHTMFQDLYFSFSENSLVIYWPEDPNWVFKADDQLKVQNEIYHSAASPAHNPGRGTVWTDLFLDDVSHRWMTTGTTPIYFKDQYLGNVSHDVMVTELLERTINVHLDGASNYVLTDKGNVVAGPDVMEQIKKNQGSVKISSLQDSKLETIWNALAGNEKSFAITRAEGAHIHELMAHYKLAGPGWIFVTTYPKSRIWWTAINNAGWVFIAGVLSLLIELYLLFQVLAKRVRKPLVNLVQVTQRLAKGDYNIALETFQPDEIGELTKSIHEMSIALQERDKRIERHNNELELLVQKRTLELAEQKLITLHSAKMAALGEMAAGISHEINTPLGIIGLNSERLRFLMHKSPVEIQKAVEIMDTISTTVGRISKIINSLRAFSRDATTDPFRIENLREILGNTLDLCSEKFATAGIQIHFAVFSEDLNIECQSVQI